MKCEQNCVGNPVGRPLNYILLLFRVMCITYDKDCTLPHMPGIHPARINEALSACLEWKSMWEDLTIFMERLSSSFPALAADRGSQRGL